MWNVKYIIGGFPNCTDKCCYYNYFRVNILFQSIFYLSIGRANSSSFTQTHDTDCGLKEEMNLTELQLGDTAAHNQLQLDNDTNQLFGVEIAMGAWWVVISVILIPFQLLSLFAIWCLVFAFFQFVNGVKWDCFSLDIKDSSKSPRNLVKSFKNQEKRHQMYSCQVWSLIATLTCNWHYLSFQFERKFAILHTRAPHYLQTGDNFAYWDKMHWA